MNEKDIKNLQKLLKAFNDDDKPVVTLQEFEDLMKLVQDVFSKQNEKIDLTVEGILQDVTQIENKLENKSDILNQSVSKEVKKLTDKVNKDFSKLQKEIRKALSEITLPADGIDGKDGYTPVKGEDYFTDEDIKEIKLGLFEEVTAEAIADKLESLKGDARLDASAIKNLNIKRGDKLVPVGITAINIQENGVNKGQSSTIDFVNCTVTVTKSGKIIVTPNTSSGKGTFAMDGVTDGVNRTFTITGEYKEGASIVHVGRVVLKDGEFTLDYDEDTDTTTLVITETNVLAPDADDDVLIFGLTADEGGTPVPPTPSGKTQVSYPVPVQLSVAENAHNYYNTLGDANPDFSLLILTPFGVSGTIKKFIVQTYANGEVGDTFYSLADSTGAGLHPAITAVENTTALYVEDLNIPFTSGDKFFVTVMRESDPSFTGFSYSLARAIIVYE
jgi:hypothetical protein